MHRTDTSEYRTHALPSAVSVVPAQNYLVYLCASSPDIASSIVDIPRPILAISAFTNTDRADALREVLQKGEMHAGSTADKRSIVLPSPCATPQSHHSETIRPTDSTRQVISPPCDTPTVRANPHTSARGTVKPADSSNQTRHSASQSSHDGGRHHRIRRIQPTDRSPCEPILSHRPSTSRKSLIQSRLAATV